MAATHINADQFDEKVLKADKPVLVDFFAQWCGPCKLVGPILDELADEVKDKYEVVKVDVDENQMLAGQHGVMSIPTVVIFKDGKEVNRKIGASSKDGYLEMLKQAE